MAKQKELNVSIIIPVYNQLHHTQKCVESLLRTLSPEEQKLEIIIVDNASTDGTAAYLQSLPACCRSITNSQNLGFAAAANRGAAAARGEYLVFLNNDIEATPGWLEEMLNIARTCKNAGLVGSKLLYPDGSIQHAGVGIEITGGELPYCPFHYYSRKPADHPPANRLQSRPYVTGACVLTRWDIFWQVGGFDENYRTGYEDIDLCLKLKENGYRVIYCPTSVLYHHESVTPGRHRYEQENREHFHRKWRGRIGPEAHLENPPATSIIVPWLRQHNLNSYCLDNLLSYTFEPFELILVCPPAVPQPELPAGRDNINIIRSAGPGLAAAYNAGIKHAGHDYILLLHDDVMVTEEWLTRMLKAAESTPHVGMVGPVSNQCARAQAVKGTSYESELEMHAYAWRNLVQNAGRGLHTNRLGDFCLLVKQEVIKRLGGFEPRLGFLAGDDYCLRARIAGFNLLILKEVFVHHFGRRHEDSSSSPEKYWTRFKGKWGLPASVPLSEGYSPAKLVKNFLYRPLEGDEDVEW